MKGLSQAYTVIHIQDTRLKSLSSNECSRAWSSVFVDLYSTKPRSISKIKQETTGNESKRI